MRVGPSAMMWCFAAALAFARVSDAVAQPAAPPPSPPKLLTGADAWAALVGNTVAGTTPDGPYSEYVLADGTVRSVDRDGPDRGKWRLRDALVCFTFPQDDEDDCRKVEVEGTKGSFTDADGSRYPFDILPGNAKNL